jgi:gliding motility-associated-like protein
MRDFVVVISKNGSSNVNMSFTLSPASSFTQLPGTALQYNYTTSVASGTDIVTLIPKAGDAGATIKVQGQTVASGTASQNIVLNSAGTSTTIQMVVTAQDGIAMRTYSVVVSRAAPSFNATLPVVTGVANKSNDINAIGITVHQALSPNGDGINDVFIIDGIENYADNHLSIMNAGGVLIYDVQGYGSNGNVFDGHSNKNSTMQKPGTYYYSLEYKDGNETKRKTGYIILKY